VNGDPLVRILSGDVSQELIRGLVTVPEASRDVRALVGQLTADGGSDAAGASGDQRYPVLDRAWPGPSCLLVLLH
jgi:hypothetical protein